jgi:hypothetical protein
MNIKEALTKGDMPDKIYIGEIAERLYSGETGDLLRALINGLITEEATKHRPNPNLPADRVLGRIEAYQQIIDDIESMIKERDNLVREQPIEEEDEDA